MKVYDKISAICQEKNMSIKKLEEAAGIGNGVVGKWRTSSPNLQGLTKIAHVLGVRTSDLLGDED